MEKKQTLAQLKTGESAIIHNFSDAFISLKLLEMGCLPGEKVTLDRIAPLGDPLMVTVAGYSLTMRKKEAETILIVSETT